MHLNDLQSALNFIEPAGLDSIGVESVILDAASFDRLSHMLKAKGLVLDCKPRSFTVCGIPFRRSARGEMAPPLSPES